MKWEWERGDRDLVGGEWRGREAARRQVGDKSISKGGGEQANRDASEVKT